MNLRNLTDDQLIQDTMNFVREERELLSKILYHLLEIHDRKLFAKYKCKSINQYAVRHLHYSDDQAWRRVNAMFLLRQLPEIKEKIDDGGLNLTNLGIAQSLFNAEDHSREEKLEVLSKIENTTKLEAERIIRDSASEQVALKPDFVRALGGGFLEIKFSAKEKLLEKIEQVKGLLSHQHPNLNHAELMNILCDIAIENLSPHKKPVREKNVAPARKSDSRTPSAKDTREVWSQAKGRCQNCGSYSRLEREHCEPWGHGGKTEIGNLRLLCRSCNQRQAVEAFGHEKMRGFWERRVEDEARPL